MKTLLLTLLLLASANAEQVLYSDDGTAYVQDSSGERSNDYTDSYTQDHQEIIDTPAQSSYNQDYSSAQETPSIVDYESNY